MNLKRLISWTISASVASVPVMSAAQDESAKIAGKGSGYPGTGPKSIKLDDSELDQVTAGIVVLILTNPGNSDKGLEFHHNLLKCINCEGSGPTSGEVVVANSVKTITRCIGKGC